MLRHWIRVRYIYPALRALWETEEVEIKYREMTFHHEDVNWGGDQHRGDDLHRDPGD
jgi:hypothetical protein